MEEVSAEFTGVDWGEFFDGIMASNRKTFGHPAREIVGRIS